MNFSQNTSDWRRRAQPLLGTVVEIGLRDGPSFEDASTTGLAAIAEAQACLSRFHANSDIDRFNTMRSGDSLTMQPLTAEVLACAATVHDAAPTAPALTKN